MISTRKVLHPVLLLALKNFSSASRRLVLSQGTRAFNAVFETAQNKLRSAFGMELVELPSRAGIEHDAAGDDANENRPNTGMKKKGAAPNSLPLIIKELIKDQKTQLHPLA